MNAVMAWDSRVFCSEDGRGLELTPTPAMSKSPSSGAQVQILDRAVVDRSWGMSRRQRYVWVVLPQQSTLQEGKLTTAMIYLPS